MAVMLETRQLMAKRIVLIAILFIVFPAHTFAYSIDKLEEIVRSKDYKLLEKVLSKNNENINTLTNSLFNVPLSHIAINSGDLNTLKVLMGHGADLSIKDKQHNSGYREVIHEGNEDIKKYIFSKSLPQSHLVR